MKLREPSEVKTFLVDFVVILLKLFFMMSVLFVVSNAVGAMYGEDAEFITSLVIIALFLKFDDVLLKREYKLSKKDARLISEAINGVVSGDGCRKFTQKGVSFFVVEGKLFERLSKRYDAPFQVLEKIMSGSDLKKDEFMNSTFTTKEGMLVSLSRQMIDVDEADFVAQESIKIWRGRTSEKSTD